MSGDRLVGTGASTSGNKAAVGQSRPRSTVAMNIIISAPQTVVQVWGWWQSVGSVAESQLPSSPSLLHHSPQLHTPTW